MEILQLKLEKLQKKFSEIKIIQGDTEVDNITLKSQVKQLSQELTILKSNMTTMTNTQ
jgi:hypothetical protein